MTNRASWNLKVVNVHWKTNIFSILFSKELPWIPWDCMRLYWDMGRAGNQEMEFWKLKFIFNFQWPSTTSCLRPMSIEELRIHSTLDCKAHIKEREENREALQSVRMNPSSLWKPVTSRTRTIKRKDRRRGNFSHLLVPHGRAFTCLSFLLARLSMFRAFISRRQSGFKA